MGARLSPDREHGGRADDVVQEALRACFERPPPAGSAGAGVAAAVALNLSLDALRRRRRRAYPGPWLPARRSGSDEDLARCVREPRA